MYKVSNSADKIYGNVVIIEITEDQGEVLPFFAMQQAFKNRRLWKESGATKVRFLVDGKIMSTKEMEVWSREEYQSLPKCAWCAKVLGGVVYTHRLCGSDLFCLQEHADKDYHHKLDKMKDEEEVESL